MQINFANVKASFKGNDGNISYIGDTAIKTFHKGNGAQFSIERDTLEFLTKAEFPFSPKFLSADNMAQSITMEKINGQTLLDYLENATRNNILFIKKRLEVATRALANLGIFHNDLNRMNVLVQTDICGAPKDIKLIDFATARKTKSVDLAQLADDMLFKKHLLLILDDFLKKQKYNMSFLFSFLQKKKVDMPSEKDYNYKTNLRKVW